MTREQYEKLKEWVVLTAKVAINPTPLNVQTMSDLEKELDKLMFPEGEE